jgi:PPK2 family polyphosphate:nucleotide phosphotransferase
MDAAGKDSTIKHVMSGINPQGVTVHSFKQPSAEELSHDYLWRAVTHLPPRGQIALFNRSYYEDVLVVRVHALWRGYKMPERCTNDSERQFFGKRYRQIRDFEEYLYENGYRVLKIFLNVSPEQQRLRFLERIDDQSKNWKFSGSDIAERKLWPSYMRAYEDAINGTATKHAPWFVIPADKKWFARWLVSEAIVDVLRQMDPHYPELPQDQRDKLADYKAQLLSEDGPRGE